MNQTGLNSLHQGDFFWQRLPGQQTIRGLEPGQCYLMGYLSNEQALYRQLNIEHGDQQALLNAAVNKWRHELNRHFIGDYLLISFTGEQLFLTSSARASYTLFYRQSQNEQGQYGLALASNLKQLTQVFDAKINPAQLMQTLALGPLADEHTCFEQISQLQSGETLIWQLATDTSLSHRASLPDAEQLTLAQNSAQPQAERLAPRSTSDIELTKLFNRLPSLAHRLGQPVVDASLAHFDALVQTTDSDTLLLDISWLSARHITCEQSIHSSHNWCKSILKRPLLAQRSQLQHRQQQLVSTYKAAKNELDEKLSFGQWLDLHYVIPAWCQLLQRICRLHGKTLVNPFMHAEQLLPLVKQAHQAPAAYFSLQQVSLANAYDAMQRLFYSGEPETLKLFDLNPLATSRLIRREQDRHRVEQLSVLLLTLDYLTRFHPGN
ncbi:hypothetical protein [Thalassomonas actiniarum]|uniref:Uncharacterized protein n=1 Tax=Thalassomonas actiniarum TaxID=485447 RepID=A0AAE9YXR5_9GAMM|nr:hypothetical protein [Thalassomonas actiniarum]WDE02319.1 hypothetical protein SG35_031710 [Thalassomonas actiniarum]